MPTPAFAVVEQPADVKAIDLPFPLFAKPVAEGTGKGVSPARKQKTAQRCAQVCEELLASYQQPVLVETYLPGREFTVGITGTGDAGAGPRHARNRAPEKRRGRRLFVCEQGALRGAGRVPPRACRSRRASPCRRKRVRLAAWRILGCRDAGRVDLRCDATGQPSFMEVNPLAGLHPEHSDLPILATKVGLSYVELIRRIVDSATPRVSEAKKSKARRFRP